MTNGTFTWTDLSTFDLEACKDFYHQVFGWDFQQTTGSKTQENYNIAYQGDTAVSAIFPMPDYLQKIKMPSFWMSYIHVEDIEETVRRAKKHDKVIVEIDPTDFDKDSKIALVRDPSGAGFTLYEGPDLKGRFSQGHGRPIWNVHHVSDLGLIKEFYADIFGWSFRQAEKDIFEVISQTGDLIAHIEVLPNSVKGDKQYWMPVFEVRNIKEATRLVSKLGGSEIVSLGNRVMFADPQGGHFMVQESVEREEPRIPRAKEKTRSFKWKTLLALGIIYTAIAFNQTWVWGLLFLIWVWPDIKKGSTFFVEPLSKKENPILYWAVIISWIWMGLYIIFFGLS